ncbi:MAG: T9SS type A sorting domain-containing protein [Sphingobacteriales bacterium]|nr:MAG: T9SS type A sorting domain-containing protein [Sphingobacteriales bacterium]
MKRSLLSLFLYVGLAFTATAKHKYIVYFSDKGNAQYKAADVTAALTDVAIEKRKKNGLSFDHYDIAVNTTYLQQLSNKGVKVLLTSRWLNAALVETDLSETQLAIGSSHIAKVQALKDDAPITPNKFSNEFTQLPGTPTPQAKTNSNINYGSAGPQNLLYGIDYLHDKGYTGKGITVAFLDAGFNTLDFSVGFDSLRARNGIKATYDFWDAAANVYHKDSHGTFCATYTVGNIKDQYVGMAPAVDVLLGITDDQYTETHQDEFNYIAGVEWAEAQGADIISASISYKDFDAGEGDYDLADMDGKTTISVKGARIAAAKGLILINSAGNAGIICTPCDADSILCVGGAKADKTYDGISSFGPTADGRVKPDIAAQTMNVVSLNSNGTSLFSTYGGTSSATPQIAGFAACLMQANPTANNYQVIQAIKKSSHNYDFPDNNTGYGVPNAKAADDTLRVMLAVKDVQPVAQFNLYPNPATNEVYIEGKEMIRSVTVTALTGQVVASAQPGRLVSVLDISHIPAGNYIVSVQTEKGSVARMLTKQ